MLYDSIKNWNLYQKILPKEFNSAVKWILDSLKKLPPSGKYPIEGKMFAIVQTYDTKPVEGAEFENHHSFIDLQYIVNGYEWIYWSNPQNVPIKKPYLPEKDIEFFDIWQDIQNYTKLSLGAEMFAIFWPGDWHMPNIKPSSLTANKLDKFGGKNLANITPDKQVTKIVVKIPVEVMKN
jgi:YhcH/YjgK/YiaL family protein